MLPKISAILITKNEAGNIERCLRSLQWVDEVIIVDGYSTDGTVEKAKKFSNVKVLSSEFLGYSPTKRLAVKNTRNDWVFWIDADEQITPELRKEILKTIKNNFHGKIAYDMPRKTFFLGEWVKHTGWYPGRVVRLFNKNQCDFNDNILHEGIHIEDFSKVGHFRSNLLHYSYTSLYQYFEKMNFYGRYGAEELIRKRKKFRSWLLIVNPFWAFIKFYFFKRGFLDGKKGLIISIGSAFANFIKYSSFLYLTRKQKARRIIISRTDNIGDVVLTLPLAGIIKLFDETTEIFFIGKNYTRPIIDSCVHIDKFLDRDELIKDYKRLEAVNADAIIHVFPDLAIARAAKKAGIRYRIGTNHRIFHWFYCNKLVKFTRRRSDLHEAELNLKLLEPLGIDASYEKEELFRHYGMSTNTASIQPGHLSRERFNLIMHPKSKGSAREWPTGNYLNLAKALDSHTFRIFITGTEKEGVELRKEIPDIFNLPHVEDMTGKFHLDELISFIGQCEGIVACSTGPLHIASALGKKVCGIYPPMRPIHPGRWAPLGENSVVLALDKICNECKNTKRCACIEAISVQQVAGIVNGWNNKKANESEKHIRSNS